MSSGVTLSDIKGNAPDDQKQMCIDVLDFYSSLGDHFAYSVGKRLKLLEVNVGEIVNGKSRSLVVCEISLQEGQYHPPAIVALSSLAVKRHAQSTRNSPWRLYCVSRFHSHKSRILTIFYRSYLVDM